MSHDITAGAKNVDATIAGAEAGIGYQFTDHIQIDIQYPLPHLQWLHRHSWHPQ
jgi:ligand-binding SRPBCC domain-containing protein